MGSRCMAAVKHGERGRTFDHRGHAGVRRQRVAGRVGRAGLVRGHRARRGDLAHARGARTSSRRRRRFAGMRFLLGAITAALVIAVAASFRTLNGLAAGTALLLVMGALKLLEARSRRDDGIVIGVALFLLLASALATQSLARVPFYLLIVWGACAAIAIDRRSQRRAGAARGAAAVGARAGDVRAAGGGVFPVVSTICRAVLGAAARRTGDHRALRRNVAGQHQQAGQRIRSGVSRALRGQSAAAIRVVLARPGAQRLRRLHLAQACAAKYYTEPRIEHAGRAGALSRHARAHQPAMAVRARYRGAEPAARHVHGAHDRQLSAIDADHQRR